VRVYQAEPCGRHRPAKAYKTPPGLQTNEEEKTVTLISCWPTPHTREFHTHEETLCAYLTSH
jgi:hypothetical protein